MRSTSPRRFPDGAWLCELATAHDDEELAQVVAATLGVLARPAVTLADSVLDALRTRELVLVLDNCEHLVEAVGRLAEGLLRELSGRACPRDQPRGARRRGEQVWPLTSLDLPDPASPVDAVAASEAVQLFVERARQYSPASCSTSRTRRPSPRSAAASTASRSRSSSPPPASRSWRPPTSRARLDQRFQLLTGGRRSAAERHQTLRAAIEWSYEMLDPPERLLFQRLGVFPGSFDAEAVAAVAAGDGLEAWDVLDAGAGLVAKSMMMADEITGSIRYHMLETLRAFAREHLEGAGDLHPMFRRHADHYTKFAEAADEGLAGPDEVAWRRRVHLEFDNLRTAFIRCLILDEDDDVRRALRIVAALAFEAVNDRGLGIGEVGRAPRTPRRPRAPGRPHRGTRRRGIQRPGPQRRRRDARVRRRGVPRRRARRLSRCGLGIHRTRPPTRG